jgi:hypothetical protein
MSSLQLELFDRPKFREHVRLVFDDDGVECEYREQGCRVDFGGQPDVRRLVELIAEGGRTREQLERDVPALEGAVGDLLESLDVHGLLTESELPEPVDVVSGSQFYREARRVLERHHERVASGAFHRAMVDGSITRNQLVGYAIEYYHLVHLAPRLVASALAKEEPGRIPELLQDFFASELHHDRMLESALAAVSVTKEQAMLYLFEESSPDFNLAFGEACRAVGMPAAFARPILAHGTLNDEGDHGDISAQLLAEIPAVGPEERHTALKHLAIVVETLAIQEDQMLSYYGSPDALVPRLFEQPAP